MKITGWQDGRQSLCEVSLDLFREVCAYAQWFQLLDLVAMR
jgi:hypothetical protein